MSRLSSTPPPGNDGTNYDGFLGLLQDDNSNDSSFATETEFQLLHEVRALPWRALVRNVIFHIQHVKKIRMINGQDSVILYLYAKNSTTPLIYWATSLLARELLAMKEIKNLYVKSIGLRKSLSTGRDYYQYQLVHKQ